MPMRSSSFVASIGVAATACAGLTMRGAESVKPGGEPRGQELGVYRPSDCQTPSGAGAVRNTELVLVGAAAGGRVLVERTPGYDSLVVRNVFQDRGELTFQAVLKARAGRLLLHEFRIPSDPARPGRMAVANSWREVALEGGGFRGYFDQPMLTCELRQATGGLPAPPASVEAPPPPVPGAASGIGTPEPRERYAVGESVAVDLQGKLVRARVVQALDGDRYYVEYDTTPASSEWVDKARIQGRL
jgi:hypothetical protein